METFEIKQPTPFNQTRKPKKQESEYLATEEIEERKEETKKELDRMLMKGFSTDKSAKQLFKGPSFRKKGPHIKYHEE